MILASRKGFMTKLIKMVVAGFIYSAYGLILVGMNDPLSQNGLYWIFNICFINRNHCTF